MEQNAIEIKNLTKVYKDFKLDNVSFSIPTGSIMGFVGENGAGKTTTLKTVLGLIEANSGNVRVFGKDPATQRKEINEDIGVVLDDCFFSETLRIKDINAIMKEMHKRWDSALYFQYCQRFSLPPMKPIKDFSKGMRAKLKLITALAHKPKLLILDEATSGLDPVVRNEMLDIFQEFIEDETHTILISSHITSDLERVADYITFIHGGKIVFSETRDEMTARYAVAKCNAQTAAALDQRWIAGRRDTHFGTEILVSDARAVQKAFPQMLMQPASIDDIMTFFAKEHAV